MSDEPQRILKGEGEDRELIAVKPTRDGWNLPNHFRLHQGTFFSETNTVSLFPAFARFLAANARLHPSSASTFLHVLSHIFAVTFWFVMRWHFN